MLRYLVEEFNQTGNNLIRQKQITARQFEILSLFVDGKKQKEISAILDIKPDSVHYHCIRLYKRLGVHSREEAIKVFYEQKGEFSLDNEEEDSIAHANC
jgi:DNA-binding CsgD family transcriptional regulator